MQEVDGIEGAALTKSAFHSAVQALVPRELLSSAERHKFSSMLNAMFALYDRNGDQTVDTAEFVSGFSALWCVFAACRHVSRCLA